jgi:hypothetical protein
MQPTLQPAKKRKLRQRYASSYYAFSLRRLLSLESATDGRNGARAIILPDLDLDSFCHFPRIIQSLNVCFGSVAAAQGQIMQFQDQGAAYGQKPSFAGQKTRRVQILARITAWHLSAAASLEFCGWFLLLQPGLYQLPDKMQRRGPTSWLACFPARKAMCGTE